MSRVPARDYPLGGTDAGPIHLPMTYAEAAEEEAARRALEPSLRLRLMDAVQEGMVLGIKFAMALVVCAILIAGLVLIARSI